MTEHGRRRPASDTHPRRHSERRGGAPEGGLDNDGFDDMTVGAEHEQVGTDIDDDGYPTVETNTAS